MPAADQPPENPVVPPEAMVHPPNPLLKKNALETSLKQDPQRKKQDMLNDMFEQLDEIFAQAVNDGLIWGVSVSIAADESLYKNKIYLQTTQSSDSQKKKNEVTLRRRMSLVLLGSMMQEGSRQIHDFFTKEMQVRIVPETEPGAGNQETHDNG